MIERYKSGCDKYYWNFAYRISIAKNWFTKFLYGHHARNSLKYSWNNNELSENGQTNSIVLFYVAFKSLIYDLTCLNGIITPEIGENMN